MAEEKKDQAQEKIEVQEEASEQPQKEEKSEEKALPEKEFFKGDKMLKHLEKIEAEEALSKPKEVEEKPEKVAPEKKTKKQAEEKKPFKVFKHKGKEIAVQTEEEYDNLASQGFDYTFKRQEDSRDRKDWEKGRDEKESKLLELGEGVSNLIKGIERGDFKIVPTGESESEQDELEDLDPEIRDQFKKLHEENKGLKEELGTLSEKSKVGDEERQVKEFKKASVELDALRENVREEIPFEIVKDGERNLSGELFNGLVTVKNYQDRIRASQDKDFKVRNFEELFKDSAKDLQVIENFYKGQNSGIEDGETVTSEILKAKYPELITEIRQAAVEAHLEGQELAPASVKSIAGEARETKKVGKITGLADGISQGFEDPEVTEGLKQFSKTKFGLKND